MADGLNQQVQRGTEAAQVLENVAFKEALQIMRDDSVRAWRECPIRDREGQLLLLQHAKLVDKFEGILRGLIENGKAAQRRIDIEDARSESKAKRIWRKVA